MRKILFLLTTAVMMLGCTEEETTDRIVFTLFNETNQDIRILGFDTQDETSGEVYSQPIAAEEIQIQANSSYTVTRYTSLDEALLKAFYSIEGVDYVRIIFNNERTIVYRIEETQGTLQFNIFKGDESCQHFITQEDYNNAGICNDDCD